MSIVGGQDAYLGKWPWMAFVQVKTFSRTFQCGGSLLNDRWVLTAAHCLKKPFLETCNSLVVLGGHKLDICNEHQQTRSIRRVILHEGYTNTNQGSDIALVELDSPVSTSKFISPVTLADSSDRFNETSECWATGWGNIGTQGIRLRFLKMFSLPLKTGPIGELLLHIKYTIQPGMMCAGFKDGRKDTCQGDSGGPLVCKRGNRWVQAGVVSFGKGCAQPFSPGVYTRVSSYKAWITEEVVSPVQCPVQRTSYRCLTTGNCPPWCAAPPLLLCQHISESHTSAKSVDVTLLTPYLCWPPLPGSRSSLSRIAGGQDAKEGEWPWMVYFKILPFKGKPLDVVDCGGSLIDKNWVLTAAHCFDESLKWWKSKVILGAYQLDSSRDNRQTRSMKKVIIHEQYSSPAKGSDIALVELDSPVSSNAYIRPITLAGEAQAFNETSECWATGWGDALKHPRTLQEVQLPIIDNKSCQKMQRGLQIRKEMMCAGLKRGGKDTCQGDSGGPLVCKERNSWVQVGIVSFGYGKGCARSKHPGIYTRVSSYRTWIKNILTRELNIKSLEQRHSRFDRLKQGCRSDRLGPSWKSVGLTERRPDHVWECWDEGGNVNSTINCPSHSTTTSLPYRVQVASSPLSRSSIVGGQDAKEGRWPWMASLNLVINNITFQITQQNKTNTHKKYNPLNWWESSITLGGYQLSNSNEYQQTHSVKRIIKHERYYDVEGGSDVALIELNETATINQYVKPVALAEASNNISAKWDCWATGWGNVGNSVSLSEPETLQEVRLPIIDNLECQKMLKQHYVILPEMLCAGYEAGGKDTCQGDSGGPLVCRKNKRSPWLQAGIVSFGLQCAVPLSPGIYTRVSTYRDWIKKHTGI
uniref:Peptidase S1 domain-containing protein n=1 Tax=Lepisosteus oculatus TaxID=7918 RepID=W5LXI2_LEPOC